MDNLKTNNESDFFDDEKLLTPQELITELDKYVELKAKEMKQNFSNKKSQNTFVY